MELRQLKVIKAQVATKATAEQIIEMEDVVRLVVSRQLTEVALARRTNNNIETRACPHCAGQHVVLHGMDKNGRQRFKCRDCRLPAHL